MPAVPPPPPSLSLYQRINDMSFRIWSRHHATGPNAASAAPAAPVMSKRSVYCLAPSRPGAGTILAQLRGAGIPPTEISLLYVLATPRRAGGSRPEPPAALLVEVPLPDDGSRAASGWFPPVGPLVVPGSEALMAGGPLARSLRTGKLESVAAGLIDFGIPTAESTRYDAAIREGGVLIAVHDPNPETSGDARRIFRAAGATDGFTIMQVFPRRLLEEQPSGYRRIVAV